MSISKSKNLNSQSFSSITTATKSFKNAIIIMKAVKEVQRYYYVVKNVFPDHQFSIFQGVYLVKTKNHT